MWMCAAVIVVAFVLVLATGSGGWLLLPLGCVLMMGVMMWMMMGGGMGGRGGGSDGR
jgi:hypothetical protein